MHTMRASVSPQDRHYSELHFTDEETDAQRDEGACPRPQVRNIGGGNLGSGPYPYPETPGHSVPTGVCAADTQGCFQLEL